MQVKSSQVKPSKVKSKQVKSNENMSNKTRKVKILKVAPLGSKGKRQIVGLGMETYCFARLHPREVEQGVAVLAAPGHGIQLWAASCQDDPVARNLMVILTHKSHIVKVRILLQVPESSYSIFC